MVVDVRQAVIREVHALFTAVRFLTRIPLPPVDPADGTGKAPAAQAAICHSVRWYAAVGVLLGALLWLAAWILHVVRVPAAGGAALLVVLDILLTGGLHLDGWMDTADGLGSWRSRETMLAIMRDSRVGAMGVLAASGALLVEWSFLQIWWSRGAAADVLLAAWGLGRWVMAWAVAVYPYAREEGMGAAFRGHIGIADVAWAAVALVVPVSVAVAAHHVSVLLGGMVAFVAAWGWAERIVRKLGGLTGDVYGALCVATQLGCLVAVEVIQGWMR